MKKPKVIHGDADDFAKNKEPALVILAIRRDDIEACNIASAMERLHVFTDNKQNVMLYRESVALMVDGYNEDSRELAEIPEVKKFFKRLTEDWPHWLWFLNKETSANRLLISLLCEVRVVRRPGGFETEIVDRSEAVSVITDMVKRGGALFKTYGIPKEESDKTVNSAIKSTFD